MVYDTDLGAFQFWNGSVWSGLGGADTDWTISGNNIYNANTGNVGIKTNAPVTPFQIGDYFHFDTISPPSGGFYTLIANNLTFNGIGWGHTINGPGEVIYMGASQFGIELYDSLGTGSMPAAPVATFRLDSNIAEIRTEGQYATGLSIRPGGNLGLIIERSNFNGNSASLEMEASNGFRAGFIAPNNLLSGDYLLTLPDELPSNTGDILTPDIFGNLYWSNAGGLDSRIQDLDNNTSIETDADSTGTIDDIRFSLNGTEHFRMIGSRLEFLNSNTSVFIGQASGQSAGNQSVAVGFQALMNGAGNSNTAIGFRSLQNATGGNNSALGFNAGFNITPGSNNTMLGNQALGVTLTGNNNVGIGFSAGISNTTGSNNTFLGMNAGRFYI